MVGLEHRQLSESTPCGILLWAIKVLFYSILCFAVQAPFTLLFFSDLEWIEVDVDDGVPHLHQDTVLRGIVVPITAALVNDFGRRKKTLSRRVL